MSDYKLYNGNCLDELKNLDDNSVDSIVTDPPYGLSFMGKKWDYDVPSEEIWRECLRVLKPGGHLLAFAGTRTQHRMAVRIEDAGFEIRDMIAWVYGCLSEDTKVVTPEGEKPYTSIKPNDLVLCYDKYKKEYSYQAVEEVYEYDIKDTAYRIQSDHTDQIVSKNHRCLVERGGRELFVFAEELETQENIPFLEDLSGLQSTLSDIHKGAGNQKQNMFKGVQQSFDWVKKHWKQTTRQASCYGTSRMLSLWDSFLQKQKTFRASREPSLFSPMQRSFTWEGMETTCPQRTPELEVRIRESISEKNDWEDKSKLEGWNNLQATQRQSHGSEVCSLSRELFGYGKKRWLYNGASAADGSTGWKIVESDRSGASYKSRSVGQSNRKSDVVCKQQRSQTIREWAGHKTTLATITPFEYEGKIWCVKVPTGAFVAVRNGKAFTTGNSGFPKSMDVSKAIDKAAGAERTEILGVSSITGARAGSSFDDGCKGVKRTYQNDSRVENYITAPATDAARQWQGWGTALKPALEPITVARKPLTGTVAANVLQHGTGAMNIDGCRVDGGERPLVVSDRRLENNTYGAGLSGSKCEGVTVHGRWPANLIHDGSDEVVGCFPQSKGMSGGGIRKNQSNVMPSIQVKGETNNKHLCRGDDGSAARFFYCAKASKKDRDEGLDLFDYKPSSKMGSGIRSSVGLKTEGTTSSEDRVNKNHHPTVKPTDLMRYLCRLITPPNGTVLDPFMGSGSTGKAAMLENFNFIGIELDSEYMQIAEARIKHAKENPDYYEEKKSTTDKKPKPSIDDLFDEE